MYDPNTSKILSKASILKMLKSVIDGSNVTNENIPVGILSGLPREEFFTAYELLSQGDNLKTYSIHKQFKIRIT